MSIIIKGMDMPKKGSFTIIHVYGDGSIGMPVWGRGIQKAEYMKAQQLPPHGRLIDADALEEESCDVVADMGEEAEFGYSHGQIQNAPTIIEAEEAEQ